VIGLGDIYLARELAAEAAAMRRLSEASDNELVAAGICPYCRGDGCETCDETGRAWRCFECERLISGEQGESMCCQSCNDGEPDHTATGLAAIDFLRAILESCADRAEKVRAAATVAPDEDAAKADG